MSLSKLATATYSTKRPPNVNVSTGKSGTPVVNLTGVLFVPLMPASSDTEKQALGNQGGLTGQMIKLLEAYTQKQSHTDSSVVVNQVPDIKEGDILVDDSSNEYEVRRVDNWPQASNLLPFLRVVLEEQKHK